MVASPKRKCGSHFQPETLKPAQALVLHSDALVRVFVLVWRLYVWGYIQRFSIPRKSIVGSRISAAKSVNNAFVKRSCLGNARLFFGYMKEKL